MLAKHPKSFPQASLPTLYNVVKRCRAASAHMPKDTCFAFPLYGPPRAPQGANAAGSSSSTPNADAAELFYNDNPSNPNNDPRESSLLYYNDDTFVVNDVFNKSRFHCLVMPWDTKLKSLNDLNASHVPLLLSMQASGQKYINHLRATRMGPNCPAASSSSSSSSEKKQNSAYYRTIMGFHAIPSLPMLHMHIMSLDLESEKLKKKQHFNTFSTYYFLPFDAVLDDLKRNKTVTINQDVATFEKLANQTPMKCLWCGTELSNMPAVKQHVPNCPKNMSRE